MFIVDTLRSHLSWVRGGPGTKLIEATARWPLKEAMEADLEFYCGNGKLKLKNITRNVP